MTEIATYGLYALCGVALLVAALIIALLPTCGNEAMKSEREQ